MNTKLNSLRQLMFQNEIDAYIIPSTDPHQCEYVPKHWAVRQEITGFSGSAGVAVVTRDFAGLWTDSRYFIQAKDELRSSGFELVELKIPHTPEYIDWLADNLSENSNIGIWGEMVSVSNYRLLQNRLSEKKIKIHTHFDFISPIWLDRPILPKDQIFIHEIQYAGKSRTKKIEEVRSAIENKKCDLHLLASLDDIAWLLNLRGNDIEFNPVFIAYLIVTLTETTLYIDLNKISEAVRSELETEQIKIKAYQSIFTDLKQIDQNQTILFAADRLSYSVYNQMPENLKKIEATNPTTLLKALKNDAEMGNWRQTMKTDGVAMVRFLHWLSSNLGKMKITELSAAEQLLAFRKMGKGFVTESFGTISAYGSHAAMAHYHPTWETDVELQTKGIYLIDSGGQYLGGTTDITRTICLGEPTQQEKTDYTLALKGTIDLSMLHFPDGTKGFHIDVVARQALWMNHLNFGHGTGHGVGFFLGVHEGPHSISQAAASQLSTKLEKNMIVTIEPAFYREGIHGFRTENMVVIAEAGKTEFGTFLNFETLTLCPIDVKMVEKSLMTPLEMEWIKKYHQRVFDELSPLLNADEQIWLAEMCS